jgi:hypothetical protein
VEQLKFDYAIQAELFDSSAEAELSSTARRTSRRKSARKKSPGNKSLGYQPLGYKRFARAADAIRFAIEELPPERLVGTFLAVADVRYESAQIRRLYESSDYPLARATNGLTR